MKNQIEKIVNHEKYKLVLRGVLTTVWIALMGYFSVQ